MDQHLKDTEVTHPTPSKDGHGGFKDLKTMTSLSDDHNRKYAANNGYLMFYVFAVSLSMLELGYILADNNQVQKTLDVQFEIGSDDVFKKDLYNSLIGSTPTLGAAIGSIFGATVIKNGRRRALIINNILCAVFVAPTLILNLYSICIGRFLFGFCGGIYQVLVPRMIEETVPAYKLGAFGIVTNLSVCGGKMISLVLGVGVPDSHDTEALKTSQYWRFINAFPWLLIALELVLFIFFIKEDTIKFSIDSKDDEAALRQIKKVYSEKESQYEVLQYIKDTGCKASQNKVPLKEALCGENYRMATWYCFGLVMFCQLCGQNAILLYSSTILESINKTGEAAISPKTGTMIIGVVNFLAAFAAIWPVKYFRRKVLFVGGHLIVTASLVCIGLFAYFSLNTGTIFMICLTLCFFQLTIGPTTWIYVAEVTCNQGLGFDMLAYKFTLLAVSLSTDFLMDSPLQPWGVFWLFGGFTFLGFFYHLIFMKETKFLTDKEKKELYAKHTVDQEYDQVPIIQDRKD